MKVLFVSMVAIENNTSVMIKDKGVVRSLSAIGFDEVLTIKLTKIFFSCEDMINDINKIIRHSYYIY